MTQPPYWISYKSTNCLKNYWVVGTYRMVISQELLSFLWKVSQNLQNSWLHNSISSFHTYEEILVSRPNKTKSKIIQITAFCDIVSCSLMHTIRGLMMVAVHTSEGLVYFETTWCNIPEGCNLHKLKFFDEGWADNSSELNSSKHSPVTHNKSILHTNA
jgi:hypothetical protein